MPLRVRPRVYQLPSYSLTGDLIAYLRCGLQYRYSSIGQLPPSRPVQLWFGEFIHGVLEEAFLRYKEKILKKQRAGWPWPQRDIDDICDLIEKRLAARRLIAWDRELRGLGFKRAEVAIQELGVHLFPIIAEAEVRLSGTRPLPPIAPNWRFRRADRYEMAGIVDVLTHVQLGDPRLARNPLIQLVIPRLPSAAPPEFEVIVDYKGMRRPPSSGGEGSANWTQFAWQVQTYAELRQRQSGAKSVIGGVLIYVNELHPSRIDMELLKKEVVARTTDVTPLTGSSDDNAIRGWNTKSPLISLSSEYRFERAVRVLPVTEASINAAVLEFDKAVQEIETCRGKETHGARVCSAWTRNPSDEGTCVLCDCRTWCPDYHKNYAPTHGEMTPKFPAMKI